MKKLLTILLITLLPFMFIGAAQADDTATSSGEQSATRYFDGVSKLYAVQIVTDGTNNAKLIVYDGNSTGGKVVFEGTILGSSHWGGRIYLPAIAINSGLYCVLSGSGTPSYFVEYGK